MNACLVIDPGAILDSRLANIRARSKSCQLCMSAGQL